MILISLFIRSCCWIWPTSCRWVPYTHTHTWTDRWRSRMERVNNRQPPINKKVSCQSVSQSAWLWYERTKERIWRPEEGFSCREFFYIPTLDMKPSAAAWPRPAAAAASVKQSNSQSSAGCSCMAVGGDEMAWNGWMDGSGPGFILDNAWRRKSQHRAEWMDGSNVCVDPETWEGERRRRRRGRERIFSESSSTIWSRKRTNKMSRRPRVRLRRYFSSFAPFIHNYPTLRISLTRISPSLCNSYPSLQSEERKRHTREVCSDWRPINGDAAGKETVDVVFERAKCVNIKSVRRSLVRWLVGSHACECEADGAKHLHLFHCCIQFCIIRSYGIYLCIEEALQHHHPFPAAYSAAARTEQSIA